MIEVEFQAEMVRLINTFSPKSFPSERTKLIWDAVQDLDQSWFKFIVSQMIGDMRFAPLVKDFREAAAKERGRMANASQVKSILGWGDFDSAARPSCLWCGDDGIVEAWKLPQKIYRKQFRCKCQASHKYPKYEQWNKAMSDRYEIEPWGEHVTPEQAKKLRDNWRYLVASNANDLEQAIGWERQRSEQEQRRLANNMTTVVKNSGAGE